MITVKFSAEIGKKHKTELYQTVESLKPLVKSKCIYFESKIDENNILFVEIIFDNQEGFENNFYNNEFNIFKGALESLCNNVKLKVNDSYVNNG